MGTERSNYTKRQKPPSPDSSENPALRYYNSNFGMLGATQ